VILDREPVRDSSPLAEILSQYERYLRSERGLVTITILQYQSFVRRFLVERFGEGPFLLREVKPSDISNFVLRYGHTTLPALRLPYAANLGIQPTRSVRRASGFVLTS